MLNNFEQLTSECINQIFFKCFFYLLFDTMIEHCVDVLPYLLKSLEKTFCLKMPFDFVHLRFLELFLPVPDCFTGPNRP